MHNSKIEMNKKFNLLNLIFIFLFCSCSYGQNPENLKECNVHFDKTLTPNISPRTVAHSTKDPFPCMLALPFTASQYRSVK